MKRITGTLILLMTLVCLVSCSDEPDGKWDKMKWDDKSGLIMENGIYLVPASGGTYTFKCKNYKHIWIAGIMDNNEHVFPPFCGTGMNEKDFLSYPGEWFEVNCNKMDLTISVQPLDNGTAFKNLTVTVTAGDIFDTFSFMQQAEM